MLRKRQVWVAVLPGVADSTVQWSEISIPQKIKQLEDKTSGCDTGGSNAQKQTCLIFSFKQWLRLGSGLESACHFLLLLKSCCKHQTCTRHSVLARQVQFHSKTWFPASNQLIIPVAWSTNKNTGCGHFLKKRSLISQWLIDSQFRACNN